MNIDHFRYCENCVDWLCLQCKHAHARVRLTKDHVVTQKTREIRHSNPLEKLLCQVNRFDNRVRSVLVFLSNFSFIEMNWREIFVKIVKH